MSEGFRERLCEDSGNDSLLFIDPPHLDECVIGVTEDGRVAYDAERLAASLQKANGGTLEEWKDYAEFNILSMATGDQSPVFVWPIKFCV
jgi:hypothetical protein